MFKAPHGLAKNIFIVEALPVRIDAIGNDGVNIAGLGGSPVSDATAVVEPRGGAVGSAVPSIPTRSSDVIDQQLSGAGKSGQ